MLITAFSMKISSVKESRFTLSRFFKDLESFILPEELENLSHFERRNDFTIGYVDPADLFFHNFENILDIRGEFPSIKFTPLRRVGYRNIFKSSLESRTVEQLLNYDKFNLYIEPQNSDSRGGKRFIFADIELADCISSSLILSSVDYIMERKMLKEKVTSFRSQLESEKEKNINDKIIESMKLVDPLVEIFNKFSRCNTVFRYNRFDVGDEDFKSHYDTPYVDKEKNELSKYTILIYLTRCHNDRGLLNFNGISIKDIYPGDVYIFEQQLLHSGSAPENEGSKIFIRSELIFNELSEHEYDENVASLFNKACYFSRESIQMTEDLEGSNMEIKKYSSHLFNSTMKARMRLYNSHEDTDRLYLCKYLVNDHCYIKFITDGNHCYFSPKYINSYNETECLQFFASIVINNYFFGRNGRLSKIKRIFLDDKSESGIFKFLDNLQMVDELTIPYSNESKLSAIEFEDKIGDKATDEYRSCCYFGRESCSGCISVCRLIEAVDNERKSLSEQIESYNATEKPDIYCHSSKLFVDYKSMIIDGDRIFSPNAIFPENINFASCQCDQHTIDGEVYTKDSKIKAFVVPPVMFIKIPYFIDSKECNGYRLTLDIFRNGFMYSKELKVQQPYTIPSEKIHYMENVKLYTFPEQEKVEDVDEVEKDEFEELEFEELEFEELVEFLY